MPNGNSPTLLLQRLLENNPQPNGVANGPTAETEGETEAETVEDRPVESPAEEAAGNFLETADEGEETAYEGDFFEAASSHAEPFAEPTGSVCGAVVPEETEATNVAENTESGGIILPLQEESTE